MVRTVRLYFSLLLIALAGCASTDHESDGALYQLLSKADKAYLESRWLEASQLYSQITVMVPHDHYAWFRLGNTQIRQGRIDSAVYTYNEALKRDPQHAKTHYNLAIAYLLIATNSMREAATHIRPSDPGRRVVEDQLKILQGMVDQPAETAPRTNPLPHYGNSD